MTTAIDRVYTEQDAVLVTRLYRGKLSAWRSRGMLHEIGGNGQYSLVDLAVLEIGCLINRLGVGPSMAFDVARCASRYLNTLVLSRLPLHEQAAHIRASVITAPVVVDGLRQPAPDADLVGAYVDAELARLADFSHERDRYGAGYLVVRMGPDQDNPTIEVSGQPGPYDDSAALLISIDAVYDRITALI